MKPGTQVLAIRNITQEKVYSYGVVEYVKNAPPEEVVMVGQTQWKIDTPWFKTESGQLVYGCECWYAPPNQLAELIGDREVEHVTPDVVRQLVEEKNATQEKAEAAGQPGRVASIGAAAGIAKAIKKRKEEETKKEV